MNYTFGERVKTLLDIAPVEKGIKDAIISTQRISFKELTEAHQLCNNNLNVKPLMYYMSELTPILNVYDHTKNKKEVKTESYNKLMQRLRNEEQEKEYRSLLKKNKESGNTGKHAGTDSIGNYAFLAQKDEDINKVGRIGDTAKELKHQITTIVNVLITVISVGYAVWYWSGSSMGLSIINNGDGFRILLSLFAALIVLIAEVVVFGGYLRKVDDARTKEKKMVENRTIVQTTVIKGRGKPVKSGSEGTKHSKKRNRNKK